MHTQVLLRETYETLYGIANHDSVNPSLEEQAFGLVLKRWSEDTMRTGGMCGRMDVFIDRRMFERTGLSWNEFKTLPTGELELLIERVESYNQRESTIKGDALNQLEKQINK